MIAVDRNPEEVLLLVLAGIAVIVATGRLVGWVFNQLGQPAVVGEVVGGLLLGPSALGLFPGDPSARLFPADVQPYLQVIATLGLIIFMFVIGLELDPRVVARERRAAISVSLCGVITPFVFGAIAALAVYPSHDEAIPLGAAEPVSVDRWTFALFCGLAIAGSAFAILARVLDERKLFRTRIGSVLIGSTVVDDVSVWLLASIVLTIAAAGSALAVPLTIGGLAAFVAALFIVVRPALARVLGRSDGLTPDAFAIVLIGLIGAALFTTWLGISPILGAFFFGTAVPRAGTAAQFAEMNVRLESLSVLVLLPVFFAVTGLGVDLSEIGLDGLVLLIVFVGLATAGKMIGAVVACRLNGIRGRRAAAVGVLLNTRGLSELALIAIGRSLGVLDTTMFTVLVCTAITTTVLSGPLLGLVYPQAMIEADIEATERSHLAASSPYRVLVLVGEVDHPRSAPDLAVDVAVDLARSEPGADVVLSRIATDIRRSELGSGFMGRLGEMSDALEGLRSLSDSVSTRGVGAVPSSVVAEDLRTELVAQVRRLRPHLVVLDGADERTTPELAGAVVAEGGADVAIVTGGHAPTPTIAALRVDPGPEPDQALAIELGVRLALGRGCPVVSSTRRSAALDDLCERLGIDRTDITPDLSPHLLAIEPAGRASGDASVRVAAHAYSSPAGPRQLTLLRDRLSASGPTAEPTSG